MIHHIDSHGAAGFLQSPGGLDILRRRTHILTGMIVDENTTSLSANVGVTIITLSCPESSFDRHKTLGLRSHTQDPAAQYTAFCVKKHSCKMLP